MKKDSKHLVNEYIGRVTDEELRFLTSRLVEQFPGDLADALHTLSKRPEIDHLLASASGSWEFFDICDLIRDQCVHEVKRRGMHSHQS